MDLEQEVAILKQKMKVMERDLTQAVEVLKHVSAMLLLLDLEDTEYDYKVPEPPGGMNYFG